MGFKPGDDFDTVSSASRQHHIDTGRFLPVNTVPLEKCVCGDHVACPDGWHYGIDLPCMCTPDCARTGVS